MDSNEHLLQLLIGTAWGGWEGAGGQPGSSPSNLTLLAVPAPGDGTEGQSHRAAAAAAGMSFLGRGEEQEQAQGVQSLAGCAP